MLRATQAPAAGTSAPDAEVLLSDGATARLRDFWRTGPAALVFLRHFG
jgi:hypothetical protein